MSRATAVGVATWRTRVDDRKRNAVKGEIPRGEPGILPLIGHRDHVRAVEMPPVPITPMLALRRRWRLLRVTLEPLLHGVVVKHLAPDHAGERLALHEPCVGIGDPLLQLSVKLVGLAAALHQKWRRSPRRAVIVALRSVVRGQSQPYDRRRAGCDIHFIKRADFRAGLSGIHRVVLALHQVFVKGVLEIAARLFHAEQPARIGVVVAEQQGRWGIEIKPEIAQIRVLDFDGAWPADQRRLRHARRPRPDIAAAQLRQQRAAAPRPALDCAR